MMNSRGERLRYLLKERNMVQSELAKALKASSQLISMLCLGKRETSKLWPDIAKYFGVELNWLLNGSSDGGAELLLAETAVHSRFYKIPLFHSLSSTMLDGVSLKFQGEDEDFEFTRDAEYENLFALASTNNALKFKFGNDAVLVFHKNLEPAIGDFVVVYIPSKELFIYRDLTIENGKLVLLPIDSDLYKKLYLDEIGGFIVAVLYEKRIKRTLNDKQESWMPEKPV